MTGEEPLPEHGALSLREVLHRASEALEQILHEVHREQCRLFIDEHDVFLDAPDEMSLQQRKEIRGRIDEPWREIRPLFELRSLQSLVERHRWLGFDLEVLSYHGEGLWQFRAHDRRSPDDTVRAGDFTLRLGKELD